MGIYSLRAPYIRWGANLANAWYFGAPLDNVAAYSDPREGSSWVQGASGAEDAWIVGTDYVLEGDARWIPGVDALVGTNGRSTGWDSGTTPGVREALEWLREKNSLSFHNDGRNLLRLTGLDAASVEGLNGDGGWQQNNDAGLTAITSAYDAGENAWKITATNPTGGVLRARLHQYFPAIAAEQFAGSIDYKISGANVEAQIGAITTDASKVQLNTPFDVGGGTSTSWTRLASPLGTAAASDTALVRFAMRLQLAAGATGTAWFKNAMVRRGTADSTYVASNWLLMTLVEPMRGAPSLESNGDRRLRIVLRENYSRIAGY